MEKLLKVGIITIFLVSILAISIAAKEFEVEEEIEEEVGVEKFVKKWMEKVEEEMEEKGMPVVKEIVAKRVREKLRAGEVVMNVSPYLRNLPVFPPVEKACPTFMLVELPFDAYLGKLRGAVFRILKEEAITPQQACENLEETAELIVEKLDFSKVCEKIEEAAENCEEMVEIRCEKIENALEKCHEGLRMCKRYEKVVRILEGWEQRMKKIEKNLSGKVEYGVALWKGMAEEKPVTISRIRGVVPKCMVEEKWCEMLKLRLERCKDYVEKCAPRCERLELLAERCMESLADEEVLEERVLELLSKRCMLLNYSLPVEVEEVETEVIPPAEIQPVIIVTEPNLTAEQENEIRTIVEELNKTFTDDVWVYKALVRANRMEDLRELEFVISVKLDHIVRAMRHGTFKEVPGLPRFAPPTTKILPILEGVKAKVDEDLQPLIEKAQVEILEEAKNITHYDKEEKARGFGYHVLKWLGLQAERERRDAEFLESKARGLGKVISSLQKVAEVEEDPVVKTNLLEQIQKLQESVEELQQKAREKRRGIFGIWSFLFGLG